MKVAHFADIRTDELEDVSFELAALNSLREVLAWAEAKPRGELIPQIISAVITQDEFTHDVILPYKDKYLVFDTT